MTTRVDMAQSIKPMPRELHLNFGYLGERKQADNNLQVSTKLPPSPATRRTKGQRAGESEGEGEGKVLRNPRWHASLGAAPEGVSSRWLHVPGRM